MMNVTFRDTKSSGVALPPRTDLKLMGESYRSFAEKAKSAGVDVTLTISEKMIHCYPLMAPMFPEATQAMDEICGIIRKRLRI